MSLAAYHLFDGTIFLSLSPTNLFDSSVSGAILCVCVEGSIEEIHLQLTHAIVYFSVVTHFSLLAESVYPHLVHMSQ
jgi:hypothetical protein